jgi:F-type H+-transporting ATPase subunit b
MSPTRTRRRFLFHAAVLLGLLAPPSFEAAAGEPEHATADHGTAAEHHAAGAHHGGVPEQINWWSVDYSGGCLASDHPQYSAPPIGWAWVNFLIIIVLLVKFAGRPFLGFLRQRHEAVKRELREAAELRRRAKEQLDEVDRKLSNLDREIEQIKQEVTRDAEFEREQIITAAEAEATRIVEAADRTLAEEVKRVRRRLEKEAVEAALAAAEKLLKQRVNDADRKRLHDTYLQRLSGGGN